LEQFKKANDITIDSYSNSTVKAHVNVTNSEQSFATFTIPYHSGWSVTVDGHLFAGKAKELGANVFVASKPIKEQVGDSPVIYVKDVTRVMTLFANHFYGYPSESLNMIGVTGTNGKWNKNRLWSADWKEYYLCKKKL